MQLEHVTFQGPAIDDLELLTMLPKNLAGLLELINGYVQFHGGFHLRGVCKKPKWHSLRDAWLGKNAFHRLYPEVVTQEDIPFAQDCMGDQFLLRKGKVWRLLAETGEIESLKVKLSGFFEAIQGDPIDYLTLQPLLQFQEDGGNLEPGQLLAAYPPFCTKQSGKGVHLAAVSADERRRFLADFAAQIRDLPDGAEFDFKVVE
jgi:hypothetical protein